MATTCPRRRASEPGGAGFVARLSRDGKQIRWLTRVPRFQGGTSAFDLVPQLSSVIENGDVMMHAPISNASEFSFRGTYLRLGGEDGQVRASALTGLGSTVSMCSWRPGEILLADGNSLRIIDRDGRELTTFENRFPPSVTNSALVRLDQGGALWIGAASFGVLRTMGLVRRLNERGELDGFFPFGGSGSSTVATATADPWGNVLAAGTANSTDSPLRAAV